MANLNPFFDEQDFVELEDKLAPEFDEITLNSVEKDDAAVALEDTSLDAIAARLLKDNLILTALELHTELAEARKELPRLRDFFSNPGNFERTKLTPDVSPPGLPRTSSIQTFDSLDFARYSDDGDRQEIEKVAVLEFELRKAHDTIKSLRASLTKTAETVPTPDSDKDKTEDLANEEIKPHEKRAINYLVNEYLLTNNYKITSVTFAEENENQDFEDWDDVGLNTAKPPDLLHLYRDYGQHISPTGGGYTDVGVHVNLDEESGVTSQLQALTALNNELKEHIQNLEVEIEATTNENAFLANQIKQFEKVSDASTVKSSTPVISPISTPAQTPAKLRPSEHRTSNDSAICERQTDTDSLDSRSLGDGEAAEEPNPKSSCHGSGVVNNAATCQNEAVVAKADDMPTESAAKEEDKEVFGEEQCGGPRDVNTAVPDVQSHNGEGQRDGGSPSNNAVLQQGSVQEGGRRLPQAFQDALMNLAFHVSPDNRIVNEVTKINDADDGRVILMLARCLPYIVPNVILAKREELIPVILTTATLHPDAKQRDQLLNILFNLIKKPDVDQRHMILTGCVAFAQHVGPQRVESEMLPQCWEQIAHKYAERRLLVADACGALAAYLPPDIRSSLVLSMLQQMLEEEKEETVREAIVRSLGILYGFVSDHDKYIQGGRLLMKTLVDTSERVSRTARKLFLPTFAMWTIELKKLEADLYPSFLRKLIDLVKSSTESHAPSSLDKARFTLYTQCMHDLLPFLFVMILHSAPFAEKASMSHTKGANSMVSSRFPKSSSALTDVSVICGDAGRLMALVRLYEDYIAEEWYEPWDSYAWVAGEFIPEMINFMNSLEPSLPTVVHSLSQFVHSLCRTFGRTFTITKVRQKFQRVLSIPENHIVSEDQVAFTRCTAAVYVAGVLASYSQEEDNKALEQFVQDLMISLSLSRLSLDSIKAAVQELSEDSSFHDMLLTVLWAGVVNASPHVRKTAALLFEILARVVSEALVSSRVLPALVTLASDPEISVRVSTVPALGTIVETASDRAILDKVHMQLESFMDEPTYQKEHTMHVELIRTLARVGPNAEPKFRDDFVLPRLAVFAASNNHMAPEAHRREVALQLFEAYSSLSCCFINDHLVSEVLLPGLRCLHRDVQEVAQDHVTVLESMIREFEEKVDSVKIGDRVVNQTGQSHSEAVKAKMFSRFKDVTSRFGTKK